MIIAGGTYGERCLYPRWDQIYGSGLRAAIAVSEISRGSTLHTYVPAEWRDDVEATLSGLRLRGQIATTGCALTYSYLTPFEQIERPSRPARLETSLQVEGEVVLRFGMVEGDARVTGRRVVYDPRSSNVAFDANGSLCDRLALVLTGADLFALADEDMTDDEGSVFMPAPSAVLSAVTKLKDQSPSPEVVLVKDGLGGLTLFRGDEPILIPTYAAESYFRIGSGDVVAAAFAHAWGELEMAAEDAADYAARCLAYFVEGPRLPLPAPRELAHRDGSRKHERRISILGVGEFELDSLVYKTNTWIKYLGGEVHYLSFGSEGLRSASNYIDLVLLGSRSSHNDLSALSASVLDPAVVFWPVEDFRSARYFFPRARITNDYASALYHVMRRRGP